MIKKLTSKQRIILGVVIGIIAIFVAVITIYLFNISEEENISTILLDENLDESNLDESNLNGNKLSESNLDGSNLSESGLGFNDVNNEENSDINNLDKNNSSNDTNLNSTNENGENSNDMNGNQIPEEERIVVHIMGEVKKTGIIYLRKGARIADAIKVAGGVTKEADIDAVNLAYVLQDGQKINIPNKKDKEKNGNNVYITSESGNNVIIEDNSQSKGVNKKVNINEASQSDLETLPGIGPSIASRIIEYREQNGKFSKIEDLQNVKGIGDAKYNRIKDSITVK